MATKPEKSITISGSSISINPGSSFALYVNPYEADRILAEINELKVEHFNFEAYLESHGVKRGVSGGYCFA